jgi:tetratricopeptide (TPR) repeat protein
MKSSHERRIFRFLISVVGLLSVLSAVPRLHAEVQVLSAAPAPSEKSDLDLCSHSLREPDAGIPACTRLIEVDRAGREIVGYLNNRGVAKIAKDDLESAIKDFTGALDRKPNFVDGFRNRGLAYHMLGDFESAIADFKRALKLDDKSAALYNARGAALVNIEQLDLAIADFDRALKLDRSFASAYYNRGQARYLKKDFVGAVTDLDSYIKLVPNDPKGYVQRGDAHVNNGDFAAAIADFGAAIGVDAKNWEAYSHRGEAWRLQGDLEKSMADHDTAIGLEANSEAFVNRALTRADQSRFAEAIADCGEAILLRPRYDLAYANRGRFRRLAGDLGGSLKDLDKALELNPRSFRALTFRGETLLTSGYTERASADFTESLRIAPDFVAAYTGRGLGYEKQGDLTKAKADFAKATSLRAVADAGLAKPAQESARTRLAAIEKDEAAAKLQSAQRDVREKERAEAEKTRENERERKQREELERLRAEQQIEITRLQKALEAKNRPEDVPEQPPLPDPGRRVALVIGNSNYRSVAVLPNPQRDAKAVAATLRKLGFETVLAQNDLTRDQFRTALNSFEDKAKIADWAVVYYAGHGIEVGGINYLIPVDAKLFASSDVEWEAVKLDLVLQATQRAKKLRLVLLDACRNNPFANRMRVADGTRSVGRGFARIEPAKGTLVAYAAKDGEVAQDGDGEHSPFTVAFLKYATKPRLEINLLFRNVRDEVLKATGGAQEPFIYSSLPGEEFYLAVKEVK